MIIRLTLILLVAFAALAPAANAANPYKILRDCALDGKLDTGGGGGAGGGGTGTGTGAVAGMSEAAQAVAVSPASGIREQVLAPGTDGETAAVEEAKSAGSRGVDVGGKAVVPGATGLSTGADARDLPPSLLAVLILLGAGTLALAVPAVRKHARIPVFRRR
jgi:hypothetical protein